MLLKTIRLLNITPLQVQGTEIPDPQDTGLRHTNKRRQKTKTQDKLVRNRMPFNHAVLLQGEQMPS